MGNFWGCCRVQNSFGSTHVVDQLSFSMIPLILTFEFDTVFGLFLPNPKSESKVHSQSQSLRLGFH